MIDRCGNCDHWRWWHRAGACGAPSACLCKRFRRPPIRFIDLTPKQRMKVLKKFCELLRVHSIDDGRWRSRWRLEAYITGQEDQR